MRIFVVFLVLIKLSLPNKVKSNKIDIEPGNEIRLYTDNTGHIRQYGMALNAAFNVIYNDSVVDGRSKVYTFTYNETRAKTTAVRISLTNHGNSSDFPIMCVVRQEQGIMSWQVPLLLQYKYSYFTVSRTLCPLDKQVRSKVKENQRVVAEISTFNNKSIDYSLEASILTDFEIGMSTKKSVSIEASEPQYYMYTFPEGISSVVVAALSKDSICMAFSVQDVRCPVYDLDRSVEYQGMYQTMTKQGFLVVNNDKFEYGSFYIVLVVKPNDLECSGIEKISAEGRLKNITLEIRKALPAYEYYKATLVAVGVFLGFYLMAFIIGVLYHGCKKDWGIVTLPPSETSSQEDAKELINTSRVRGYGATGDGTNENQTARDFTDSGSIGSDIDFLPDAEKEKDIYRTKAMLYIKDLSRKSERKQEKAYRLYSKNLITIAIFYGLPVIQLVLTYQKVFNVTGDQDICYYNFGCAHPLGELSSFNNIFSNIGYVMLGILFLLLVARRQYLNTKAAEMNQDRHHEYGIPQHFGLFYAMGVALCMEGIMSGCYHVCPNYSNFQFDTSFMYIIACLCILKIYQTRHPDISAKAHNSYLVMALVIIVAVLGVIYGTNIFWLLFALVYMMSTLLLSIHVYYLGRWQLDRYVFKRLWLLIRTDWLRCSPPTYKNRMVLLTIGILVNWGIALYGAVVSPTDFATLLLAIFIVNLLLYMTFYGVNKLIYREKIAWLTIICILLACVFWGFALKFFFAHLTSWQLTAANSREGNQNCILLDFYDAHDVWHFLSAISLFFSFLVLLTLDDEIIFNKRDRIPVF